jgi:hypothetical protein
LGIYWWTRLNFFLRFNFSTLTTRFNFFNCNFLHNIQFLDSISSCDFNIVVISFNRVVNQNYWVWFTKHAIFLSFQPFTRLCHNRSVFNNFELIRLFFLHACFLVSTHSSSFFLSSTFYHRSTDPSFLQSNPKWVVVRKRRNMPENYLKVCDDQISFFGWKNQI